jgi:hypothetical protein
MEFMNRFVRSRKTPVYGLNLDFMIKSYQLECPDYVEDYLKTEFKFFYPTIVMISFLVTFVLNVSSIIIEKETKVKVKRH